MVKIFVPKSVKATALKTKKTISFLYRAAATDHRGISNLSSSVYGNV